MKLGDFLPLQSPLENANSLLQRSLVLRNAMADSEMLSSCNSTDELLGKLSASTKLCNFFEAVNWIRSHYSTWQQYVRDLYFAPPDPGIKGLDKQGHLAFTLWLASYCGVIDLQPGAAPLVFSSSTVSSEKATSLNYVLGNRFSFRDINSDIYKVWRRFGSPKTVGIDSDTLFAQIRELEKPTSSPMKTADNAVSVATWLAKSLQIYALPVLMKIKNRRYHICFDMNEFHRASCIIIALTGATESHLIDLIDCCGWEIQSAVFSKYRNYMSQNPQKLIGKVEKDLVDLLSLDQIPNDVLSVLYDERLYAFGQNHSHMAEEKLFISDTDPISEMDYSLSSIDSIEMIDISVKATGDSRPTTCHPTNTGNTPQLNETVNKTGFKENESAKNILGPEFKPTRRKRSHRKQSHKNSPRAPTPVGLGLKRTSSGKITKITSHSSSSGQMKGVQAKMNISNLLGKPVSQIPNLVTPAVVDDQYLCQPSLDHSDKGTITPKSLPDQSSAKAAIQFQKSGDKSTAESLNRMKPPIPEKAFEKEVVKFSSQKTLSVAGEQESNAAANINDLTTQDHHYIPMTPSPDISSAGAQIHENLLGTHNVEIPSSNEVQKVNIIASINLPAGCTLVDFKVTIQTHVS